MDETTKQFYVDLGKKIAKERKRKKLSQYDMASLLGVTQSAVSQQEQGMTGISAYTLWRISAILHVAVVDLLPTSAIPRLAADYWASRQLLNTK